MNPNSVIPKAIAERKLVIIAGPCSIHNWKSAHIVAHYIKTHIQAHVSDEIQMVMRVYLDKPRTGAGWDGLIHTESPEVVHSNMIDLCNTIPIGTEILDIEKFRAASIEHLLSFGCIGARTVDSQPHRRLAAELSFPVYFKNSMDGSITSSVNAVKRASDNPDVGIMLRGGPVPNYDLETVTLANEQTNRPVFVDCSHGNSGKDYTKQPEVFEACVDLFNRGLISGMMLEAHVKEGRTDDFDQYLTSVTDSCISLDTLRDMVLNLYAKIKSTQL